MTEQPKNCYDCLYWRGVCAKGYRNVIACDPPCGDFKPRTDQFGLICDLELRSGEATKMTKEAIR